MELYLLGTNAKARDVITDYISLLWVKRYYGVGAFELTVPFSQVNLSKYQYDYYLKRNDSTDLMIIETIEIQENQDGLDIIKISGKSLESILNRRIIWNKTTFSSRKYADAIYSLIALNATRTDLGKRSIPELSVDNTFQCDKEETLDAEYLGEHLDEVITELCQLHQVGWKIENKSDLNSCKFEFSLYRGEDKTGIGRALYAETGDLTSVRFIKDKSNFKNVALGRIGKAYSEDWSTGSSAESGIERREYFVDGSSIDDSLSDEEITAKLHYKGKQQLITEHNIREYADAEATNINKSVNLGDIISIFTKYGNYSKARVIEFAYSWDETGYKVIPTFEDVTT